MEDRLKKTERDNVIKPHSGLETVNKALENGTPPAPATA